MSTDPRVIAVARCIGNFTADEEVTEDFLVYGAEAVEVADAADREQGIHRVSINDDTVHAVALVMAQHHRLEPMTSKDRCTCGFVTPLGHLFSSHVARAALAALTASEES